MLLTLVPVPATEATEALEGVASLLSHEVFGTFVRRLVFSAARVEERVTLLMAEIRERGLNRRKAIEVGAEDHEHLVANIVNALQDKNLKHLYIPFAPEVQINVIAATFTILRGLTSLKQSFSRHEHAFKVTNPGRANLGIMSLVSIFCKEGSPDDIIAVGSDSILSLT
ncbi:hypothetical protein D6C76_05300 [Aureobasidium pullulans]|nr:hypothetical protein D6C76_05300 [Aureobasidium pullulans]